MYTKITVCNDWVSSIQNEVREHFGWSEEDDIKSAIAMLGRVENSTVGIWARHNRAASLSKIFRRIVIREARIAILGAAVEPDESRLSTAELLAPSMAPGSNTQDAETRDDASPAEHTAGGNDEAVFEAAFW